jgi:pimeloyl-ACP methyl ester carboxylesterase
MNVDCSQAAVQRLEEKVELLVERQGQRAAIVGQSRGGHFARVLAKRRPDLVAGVVTLGSPLTEPLALHPLVRAQVYAVGALGTFGVRGLFRHSCLWGDCCNDFWADAEAPFPKGVRFLSVYSKTDGVVRYQSCLDPYAEHLEINASHIGMGMHPVAWRAVAEELERLRRSESRRQAALRARRRSRAQSRQARGRIRRVA